MRQRGWHLAECGSSAPGGCAGLVDTADGVCPESFAPGLRRRSLVLALRGSAERTRWLAAGFADALPADVDLGEIDLRATRLIGGSAEALTLRRHFGRLTLDLIERDARCDGRRVGLHPREFALLWRLCDAGGEAVTRKELLRDVWGMRFAPETNSVVVHVCRLRSKLAAVGLDGAIVTEPGGYRFLAPAQAKPLDGGPGLRELTFATSAD